MLTARSLVVRDAESLAQEIDGELVMMSVENGEYYHLDRIGTQIWNRIAEPMEVEALCEELNHRYDAGMDVIRKDVLTLLDRLVEKGLVQVRSA